MLKLHGFSTSNYYNVVKLALLEKGAAFEESVVYTGASSSYRPDYLQQSPLGKVPCLETDEGCLAESRCIVDYLERAYPQPALYPSSPFAVAKLLEFTQVVDLYLELAARRLLPNLFTRTTPHAVVATEVRHVITKGAKAIAQLADFDTFALGAVFSAADIAAVIHFPMVRMITMRVLDCDPLGEVPGVIAYLARMEQRPTVARIRVDQVANLPDFLAHIKKQYAAPQ